MSTLKDIYLTFHAAGCDANTIAAIRAAATHQKIAAAQADLPGNIEDMLRMPMVARVSLSNIVEKLLVHYRPISRRSGVDSTISNVDDPHLLSFRLSTQVGRPKLKSELDATRASCELLHNLAHGKTWFAWVYEDARGMHFMFDRAQKCDAGNQPLMVLDMNDMRVLPRTCNEEELSASILAPYVLPLVA